MIGLTVGLLSAIGRLGKPVDAVAYWEAGRSTDLYPELWSEVGTGYLFYPPPVAQLSSLMQPLGWGLFVTILMTGIFGALWYCARDWSIPLILLGLTSFVGITPAIAGAPLAYALLGNLQWIIAALVVAALRIPALWSLTLLTKVTVAIGWWWHVLRKEWRPAGIGAAATLLLIAASAALAPTLWIEYLGFATRNFTAENPPMEAFPVPLGVRLLTGIPVLVWGARTNRRWTVPVVCGWSLVGLFGFGFLPFWIAGARLWRSDANAAPGQVMIDRSSGTPSLS